MYKDSIYTYIHLRGMEGRGDSTFGERGGDGCDIRFGDVDGKSIPDLPRPLAIPNLYVHAHLE